MHRLKYLFGFFFAEKMYFEVHVLGTQLNEIILEIIGT